MEETTEGRQSPAPKMYVNKQCLFILANRQKTR